MNIVEYNIEYNNKSMMKVSDLYQIYIENKTFISYIPYDILNIIIYYYRQNKNTLVINGKLNDNNIIEIRNFIDSFKKPHFEIKNNKRKMIFMSHTWSEKYGKYMKLTYDKTVSFTTKDNTTDFNRDIIITKLNFYNNFYNIFL
jgi:hypothetical protein